MKAAQLLKLIESLEEFMIQETVKKLTKDLNLAFAERGREEGALPTDLWKRPVSGITSSRPKVLHLLCLIPGPYSSIKTSKDQ